MAKKVYVFDAKLSGWRGVRRTIAIPCEATLGDLHRALQTAFGWGDDHLYAFWVGGKVWAKHKTGYVHPLVLEATAVDARFQRAGPRRKSAERRLDRLRLAPGQRLAYLFDFAAQWRVRLTLSRIAAADGGHYPRVMHSVGLAPPQHISFDEHSRAA